MKKKFILLLLFIVINIVNDNSFVYAKENIESKIDNKIDELVDNTVSEMNDDPFIVVSLGDSYSSGEGVEPFYGQNIDINERMNDHDLFLDWLAHRSQNSWPGQLKFNEIEGPLANYKDENWYFMATSGATTKNLNSPFTKFYNKDGVNGQDDIPRQLGIFENLKPNSVDYVTITIGGNDVDFSKIIANCYATPYFLHPHSLTDQLDKKWDELENSIGDNIKQSYYNIADSAGPQATILVAGYPTLINKNGSGLLISRHEALQVNNKVSEFNDYIQNIVNECKSDGLNIHFISVEKAFKGHEAYTKHAYVNGLVLNLFTEDIKEFNNDDISIIASSYTMHPNEKGTQIYAKCVQKEIDKIEGTDYSLNLSEKIIEMLKGFLHKIVSDLIETLSQLLYKLISQI